MQDAVWHVAFVPKIQHVADATLPHVATAVGVGTENVRKKKACRTATNAKKFRAQKECWRESGRARLRSSRDATAKKNCWTALNAMNRRAWSTIGMDFVATMMIFPIWKN